MNKPIYNLSYLKERRRALRNNLTSAEAVLWILLKDSQLSGRKFRRQHSIKKFIVDFYCPSEKLVIELDGSSHDNSGQVNADYDRDNELKTLGLKVLRIENDMVFRHPEETLEIIERQFKGGE
jgi:very-short-patch-repair endonuclease